eukprot:1839340-Amphidinium_carterae.1
MEGCLKNRCPEMKALGMRCATVFLAMVCAMSKVRRGLRVDHNMNHDIAGSFMTLLVQCCTRLMDTGLHLATESTGTDGVNPLSGIATMCGCYCSAIITWIPGRVFGNVIASNTYDIQKLSIESTKDS